MDADGHLDVVGLGTGGFAIWTGDEDAAISIGERVETGTWFMNRCDYLDPELAWTGVKNCVV